MGRLFAILASALLLGATTGSADPTRTTGRVVNGLFTFDHPSTGALLSPSNPDNAATVCSGTMIGCQTFLTAGHCVEDSLDPNDYVVYLQHAGFFAVSDVAIHPDYVFPPADVAVVTLSTPVTAIPPTPLDTTGGHASGTTGTIAGFGRSGGGAQDFGLKREGDVSIATCSGVSNTTSICWNFENPVGPAGDDSNTCNGDSGGPLFIGGEVVGITSGGNNGTCLAPDASFDARVSFYASWIQGEGGADLSNTACGTQAQIGDAGATVTGFVGSVSAGSPDGTHSVVVPAGTDELRIAMNAVDDGLADFDLYVKAGSPPTTSDFDCEQNGVGQFGYCAFSSPAATTWHVLVRRFSGSGTYQVTATTLSEPFCGDPGNDGLPCDDGDACTTGETCQSLSCTGGTPLVCTDGVACTTDGCDPSSGCTFEPDHGSCGACNACDDTLGCVAAPRTPCTASTQPFASKLKLKESDIDAGDLFVWKLVRGSATSLADLGDPTTSTDYALCLYDAGAAPVTQIDAPAGGTCGIKPCWTAAGSKGFRYKDRDRTPDGLLKLVLRSGDEGKAKAIAKAKGENLPALPALPLALPVRVQLHADDGACWDTTFGNAGEIRNDGAVFVGKSD